MEIYAPESTLTKTKTPEPFITSAKVDIFGCRIGQFSREHALTHDDFEMLVVAEKGE